MRRILLAAASAVALAGLMGTAIAADLGRAVTKAPAPVVAPIYNWTGFYIGGHIGGAWSSRDMTQVCTPFQDCTFDSAFPAVASTDPSGFLGGAQAGYNWQTGPLVLGIEGEWSWTNADGCRALTAGGFDTGSRACTTVNWYATVAGRVGYAFDRVLVYAKGGAAFADEDHSIIDVMGSCGGGTFCATTTTGGSRTGWMVGAGIEYGITPNWSAKAEYSFMDFGSDAIAFPRPWGPEKFDTDHQVHVAKFGVNYRF